MKVAPGGPLHAGIVSLAVACALAIAAPTQAEARSFCGFGGPVAQHVLLRPEPATFYSVDALAPDVVGWKGRYYLFFSGNYRHVASGVWRTGLAVAKHPWGPFRVTAMKEPFFDGGTIRYRGRFLTAAFDMSWYLALFSSRDGLRWRREAALPPGAGWHLREGDTFLDRRTGGYDLYVVGRPGPSGADIGVRPYRHGRWGPMRQVLARRAGKWDGVDLGGPSVFRAGGETYMAYAGLGVNGGPREIGLARRTSSGSWHHCGDRPLIRAQRGGNAIDPHAIVRGGRLYLYYGIGNTNSLGGDMAGQIAVRVYELPRAIGTP